MSFQIYGVPVNKQLDEGEELQLSINSYAGNPTNKDVIWTSSDETVQQLTKTELLPESVKEPSRSKRLPSVWQTVCRNLLLPAAR